MSINKTAAIATFNKMKFKLEKHSPELLMGAGIASFAATIAFTIVGTVKSSQILKDESEKAIFSTEENFEKETMKNNSMACAGRVAVAYLPAVISGTATLGCFVGSSHILKTRAVGAAAAYATVCAGFEEYRNRVIDKYGESVDREFKYGIIDKKVKTTEVDETTGKKVKTTETVQVIDNCGAFGVYFKPEYECEKTNKTIKNANWQPNDLFNLTFIKAQCAWFNGKLDRGERVYLSEVFKALGIPTDDYPDARVVGWLPTNDGGDDGYIRFNAYQPSNNSDFLINDNGEVLLDFNTDGVILYK